MTRKQKEYDFKLVDNGDGDHMFIMNGEEYTMHQVAIAINSYNKKKTIIRNNNRKRRQEQLANAAE
ncbi:hypothetical protein D3C78_19250 [compost metagenome]